MSAFQSGDLELAELYFHAARVRLGSFLGQTGILKTQCFFWSGVYLMSIQKPLAAWLLFVQAVASCQCFVFSDGVLNQISEPLTAKESLYWSCLKSELYVHPLSSHGDTYKTNKVITSSELRLEMSLNETGASDLSYPSFFPSPPMDTGRDEGRSWYFYLAEIAMKRLINDVMRHQYVPQTSPQRFETTAIFEEQINEWTQSLPPTLNLDGPGTQDDMLRFILRGHLSKCQEVLYTPFVVDAIGISKSPRDQTADRCVSRALQNYIDRINVSEPGFQYRHHGTWLMLRSLSRSALVLLAAHRCGQVEDLLPDGWKHAVEKSINTLKFWEEESLDARDNLSILQLLLNEVTD
jgi:hypothetical protein